jgi:MerR family transcriptional regulator, light-induced transcriptional regulator
MASVAGIVGQARAFLPEFVARIRRAPDGIDPVSTRPQHPAPAIALAPDTPWSDEPMANFTSSIANLVERAVIPRVVDSHTGDPAADVARVRWHDEAVAFAALAIDADAEELLARLDAMLSSGTEIESILINILAPAARRLGIMWEQDDCDFVDVTMGLWRLQEVVRELSARVPVKAGGADGNYRAVFSAMPGEQHNFGTVIVEDIFRRAGWSTELLLDAQQGALLNAVATARYDLVGLTVSLDVHTERLPSLILAIRSVSRNPRLCILLGGRVLMDDPQLALRVGADGTAADAQSAVALADRLVSTNACREVFTA